MVIDLVGIRRLTTDRVGTGSPTSPRSTRSAACTRSPCPSDNSTHRRTMLTDLLGMSLTGEEGDRSRFGMAGGSSGALVDVFAGVRDRGLQAGGTVHHVAFRAPDLPPCGVAAGADRAGAYRSPRSWIGSTSSRIYFREPGGVLFEIATDAPGFAVDEPLLELGRNLKLPPWLEPNREQIAASLPPLQLDVDVP